MAHNVTKLNVWCADDTEPLSAPAIPGMGIPDQLKQALEQEQKGKGATQNATIRLLFVRRPSVFFLCYLIH